MKKNKYGVPVTEYSTSHFGHYEGGRWVHATCEVPEVCWNCPLFEYGEMGDYGDLWSLPYCTRGLWFPTRKNACKVKPPTPPTASANAAANAA